MRINLRKALALIISLLMLCTLIPLGAMTSVSAADANLDLNFNDGTGAFSGASIVAEGPDGSNCMKFTATGGWSACYTYVSSMDPANDYVITFKTKGSVAGSMGITIQNGDWGSFWNGPTFNVTTSWTDVSIEIAANQYPFTAGTILFKFQDVGTAMDLYIDDLVIAAKEEEQPDTPATTATNLITNGDFETGSTSGWSKYQSTVVSTDAAYEGTYGVNLVGNGGWGGMLNQTMAVENGKTYTLSFWYKTISVGVNWKIYGTTTGDSSPYGSGWISKTEWTYVEKEFVVSGDTSVILNFNGGGNGNAESVYVDNIMLVKKPEASFDGYFYNGDFEIGTLTNWSISQTASVSTDAAHTGNYGAHITNPGANYGGMIYQGSVNVVAGRTYTISLWMKVVVGYVNIQIKDGSINASTNLASSGGSSTSWKQFSFTVTPTTNYIYISFCGGGTGTVDEAYIDDVLCERVGGNPEEKISFGGSSVRDESATDTATGKGLAFRFSVSATEGAKNYSNEYVENSGKIDLDDVQYNLVRMGAVMTNNATVGQNADSFTLDAVNGTKVIDIPAVYLYATSDESVSFAVRILDIPDRHIGTAIYARPYYVYLENGEEVTVYGQIRSNNYAKAANISTADKSSIKILSIGHSFSKDVMVTNLYNMFKEGGYEEVVIGYLYMAGCSMPKHLYNIEHSLAQYEYAKNSTGTWVTKNNVTALSALKEEDWDFVTVQSSPDYIGGQTISSITLGVNSEGDKIEGINQTEYEAMGEITDWILANATNADVKIDYHMIWSFSQGCDLWSGMYHKDPTTNKYSQMVMYNNIVTITQQKVQNHEDINRVIPSATAIQNARSSFMGDNFNMPDATQGGSDGYHLNDDGDYVAALTWYCHYSGENANVMAGYTGVLTTDEFLAVAEAVNNAIDVPYAVTESTHK